MTALTMGVLGRIAARRRPVAAAHAGPAFEVAQDQAMFEMVTLGAVPLWLPLPRNLRFRAARRASSRTRCEALVAAPAARRRTGTGPT